MIGFTEGADPLVYIVDAFSADLKEITPEVVAENAGVLVKVSEGGPPRTPRDRRLAAATFKGAVKIACLFAAAGKPWGVYHYATIGRDGKRYYWDVPDEVTHFLAQYAELRAQVPTAPGLRVMLDVEDAKRPDFTDQQRTLWVHQWMAKVERAEHHTPSIYVGAHWVRRYLDDDHELGRHPLIQPHYGSNNDPGRDLTKKPIALPRGWTSRAGHQFTSNYAGGLDRILVRLSVLDIRGVCA